METQTAFIGDRAALVRELAAELSKALQAQPIEPAMNVKEAADFLKISPDQVRELAERGGNAFDILPCNQVLFPGTISKHKPLKFCEVEGDVFPLPCKQDVGGSLLQRSQQFVLPFVVGKGAAEAVCFFVPIGG